MERLIKLNNLKQRKSLLPRLEISLENHGSKWHKFTTKALQEDINYGIIQERNSGGEYELWQT